MGDVKPALPPPSAALGKLLTGCLRIAGEIVATLLALALLPFIILFVLVYWFWPWYSSVPKATHDLNDALIALASVAGVLWSGAIVAYSIHKRYTPPLRTGVQLLNFAILAPLVGLIADGAELRTAFYFTMWFYILSTLYSMTNLEMLKPGKFTVKPLPQQPNETPEQAKLRQQVEATQMRSIEVFKRVAHGTMYFALVSVLCMVTVVAADPAIIAWSCLIVLVVALFLMLPQVFSLVDGPPSDDGKPAT